MYGSEAPEVDSGGLGSGPVGPTANECFAHGTILLVRTLETRRFIRAL